MTWRGAACVAVLAAVLAGCGGGDEVVAESGNPDIGGAGAGTGPSGPPTPGPDDASVDAGGDSPGVLVRPSPGAPAGKAKPGTTDGAELVEPRPGMDNVHTVGWDKSEVRSDRVVRVYFYGGVEPCSVLDSAKAVETADTVTITLRSGSDPAKPDAMCIQIAKYKAVDVKLSKPIGDREILDGSAESTEPAPGETVTLGAEDSGRTVRVAPGTVVRVELEPSGSWHPADTDAPKVLIRASSSGGYPGAGTAMAEFKALAPGRALVSSTTDAACLHSQPACAMAQQAFSVTVVVERA